MRDPVLKLITITSVTALVLAFGCAHRSSPVINADGETKPWWPPAVGQKLANAGSNRTELIAALNQIPSAQREGLQFLLEHMPERDARTLSANYLLENVALAYEAHLQSLWRDQIPPDVFLNDILPYASVNERRDEWRKKLRAVSAPLVAECKTPAEAAQQLNRKLFPLLKVRYSTERNRPDQCPTETMASGKATCTGLAILLVDACRSVGVPARVAGTPMWTNLRGNHTWVEVWDGDWHFTGAAEPDPKGLDRGWFAHDAAQAKQDVPQHSIYATSFKPTGLAFPLVWAPSITWVSAVNVSERYAPKSAPAATNKVRLLVKVLDAPAGKRVAAQVTVAVATNRATKFLATSKDESADMNDILAFELAPNTKYEIAVMDGTHLVHRDFVAAARAQELVTIALDDAPVLRFASQACYVPPPIKSPLRGADAKQLRTALTEFFTAPAEKQATWKFAASAEKLLRENEPAVRQAAWEAYRGAPMYDAAKQDFDAKQVRFDKHLSPYTVKTVGRRPTNGWALFIAMHGGGGAPKQVNDSQWKHMQIYYREHPEAGGYIYVALRAPNDTWNGFYDVYVYPLVANLIRQFLLFGHVDANKVFIMGYSHGGYGAYAIGPKMPDRFAAIHASAAAATDGETTAKTLRNTIFTVMVGEKDTMYGRYERNKKFAAEIEQLRGGRGDIYPVRVDIKDGFGHGGLPDRDRIVEMYPAVRNPVPRELTWLMTDNVIQDFFWLHVPAPAKKQEIWASCRDNRIVLTANSNVVAASALFDARLIDFSQPVQIELNGATTSHKVQPSLRTLCETLARRGDPELAFTGKLDVRKDEETGILKVTTKP